MSAIKLRGAWNKAPLEAFELLDTAYQMRTFINRIPNSNVKQTYTWQYTENFSPDKNAFFSEFLHSIEEMIKTAGLAATPSHREVFSGRPKKIHLHFLARAIANGLDHFLNIKPTMTPTGRFTEVLHLAIQFVGDGSEPDSLSGYVESAVNALRENGDQSDSEITETL